MSSWRYEFAFQSAVKYAKYQSLVRFAPTYPIDFRMQFFSKTNSSIRFHYFFSFSFFNLFLLWNEIESSHLYDDLRWTVCARLRVWTSRRRNIILERHLTFSPSFFLFSSFLFRTKTGAVYIIAVLQYLRARRASIVADLTIIIALAQDARNEKDKQR